MSKVGYLAALSTVWLLSACDHENQRPITPADAAPLSSEPTPPSVDRSASDTPTPSTPPDLPDNDSRGTAVPGTRGINDGSQRPPHGPTDAPNGTSAPGEGPHGAPVGGIH